MQTDETKVLSDLYNLILNPATRDWERQQLVAFKTNLGQGKQFKSELSVLISRFRPLAVRNNLTPDVADFYIMITGGQKVTASKKETPTVDPKYHERAIFAGGCFWCMVEPFDQRPGVVSVLSGYTGGEKAHPTYDEVLSQTTGHVEAVEIIFDKRILSYQELLDLYWRITDPTDANGQLEDRGINYRPIIFYTTEEQRRLAEKSRAEIADKYREPIVTEIREAQTFWPAENFHQDFYKKNPKRYKAIMRNRRELLFLKRLRRRFSFSK